MATATNQALGAGDLISLVLAFYPTKSKEASLFVWAGHDLTQRSRRRTKEISSIGTVVTVVSFV